MKEYKPSSNPCVSGVELIPENDNDIYVNDNKERT